MLPKIGPLNSYGLMIGIGVIVCLYVFHTYAKKKGLDPLFIDFVEWNAILAVVFGFIASAVFQSFYNYLDNPSAGFDNGSEVILGVGIALIVLIATVIFHYLIKIGKIKLNDKNIDNIDWGLICLFAFALIAPTLTKSIINYIKCPEDGLNIGSGVTFLGGLLGGVSSFLIIYFWKGRKFNSKLLDMLSIAPCAITVAHGFGRIGCFLAGCCYGIKTDSWLGMKFPGMTYAVYPTQLFEALFLFALFGILSFLYLKYEFKYNMEVYVISYGIWRFFIEYIRGDDRGKFIGNISPSQFWSLVMVVGGLVMIAIFYVYYEKKRLNQK